MRDHVARELKGHNILAVERFQDKTRWMVEFSVLRPRTAYGAPGDETRLFLDEDGYQAVLASQKRRDIKIKRYDWRVFVWCGYFAPFYQCEQYGG